MSKQVTDRSNLTILCTKRKINYSNTHIHACTHAHAHACMHANEITRRGLEINSAGHFKSYVPRESGFHVVVSTSEGESVGHGFKSHQACGIFLSWLTCCYPVLASGRASAIQPGFIHFMVVPLKLLL